MKPTVGRIVHYTPKDHEDGLTRTGPWAGIVTEVFEDSRARLQLFTPITQFEEPVWGEMPGVYKYSETPKPGHWNWPPRE